MLKVPFSYIVAHTVLIVFVASRFRVPPGPLSSNNLQQVIYTCGPQANSAFYPSEVGK